ncbi:hypothetical protein CapIbe_011138 [Capra ibex]
MTRLRRWEGQSPRRCYTIPGASQVVLSNNSDPEQLPNVSRALCVVVTPPRELPSGDRCPPLWETGSAPHRALPGRESPRHLKSAGRRSVLQLPRFKIYTKSVLLTREWPAFVTSAGYKYRCIDWNNPTRSKRYYLLEDKKTTV